MAREMLICFQVPTRRRGRCSDPVLFFLLALLPGLTMAQEERPDFEKLRYEEDWSPLRDAALRTEPLDELKFIPLSADASVYLSLGGELRERYEYTRHPAWGDEPQDEDGVFLQRYVLHGDLHLGSRLRLFGQLYSALENGRAGPPAAIDENRLDWQQAFLDVSTGGASPRATLRLGRQEMIYGSSRLIDVREGPNVRRKFDGGRVLLALGEWQVDALALRPAQIRIDTFDDGTDDAQDLWGLYGVHPSGDFLPIGSSLDLYYLGYQNESAAFDQGAAKEKRHTLGLRLWGERAGWDWNWEFFYQGGSFGDGDIKAWSVASDTGYTWQALAWQPRLGLSANVASGDRDPLDADLETFNALFPRGNYFSEIALLGPRNFFNLHPFLKLKPHERLSLTLDVDFFWRLERADGIYSPGGGLLRSGAGSRARRVGTESSLNATWEFSRQLSFTVIYSHFDAGAFIRETGPARDIDFIELTLKAQF